MYNEELEMLIDAALIDGKLTEKEKQVLFKKAQAVGVDLDEFEMVLDARLIKLKQKQEEETKTSAPKSNKYGDVKKCPACGAMVHSYQGSCPECGYAFEGVDANAAVKELASLLRKAEHDATMKEAEIKKARAMSGQKEGFFSDHSSDRINARLDTIIETFPVPTEKAALLAFISWLLSHSFDGDRENTAYRKKCEECIRTAKIAFPNDEMFARVIDQYRQEKWKYRKKNMIIAAIAIGFFVAWFGFVAIMAYFEDK